MWRRVPVAGEGDTVSAETGPPFSCRGGGHVRRGTLQQRPKGPTPIFPIHGRLGPQSWSWRWTHLAPPLTHSGCPTSPSGLHLDPSSRAAVGALTTPSEHSTLLAVPVCRLARPGASALEQPSPWLQGGLGSDRLLPAGRCRSRRGLWSGRLFHPSRPLLPAAIVRPAPLWGRSQSPAERGKRRGGEGQMAVQRWAPTPAHRAP